MKLEKLTGAQVIWIFATVEVVLIIWLRITPAVRSSVQDAWMAIALAGLFSVVLALFVVRLCVMNPHQTLIGLSRNRLGKRLGKAIVVPYFLVWLALPAGALRLFGDFIHLVLLDRTPVWLIMLLMIFLIAYLTYSGGISGIGRFCEIAGPVTIFTLIISFILVAGNVKGEYLLPVYVDSGWSNILKETVSPASFLAEATILLAIIPFIERPQQAYSRVLTGVVLTGAMAVAATTMVLLVFGPDVAAKLRFPYFMLVRTINILDFVQNIDIFVIFIWIFGLLARLSLYLFIFSYEAAQWLRLRDWRLLVWFGAAIIYTLAMWVPNESFLSLTDQYWKLAVFPVCGIAIPLLLLIASAVKNNRENNE